MFNSLDSVIGKRHISITGVGPVMHSGAEITDYLVRNKGQIDLVTVAARDVNPRIRPDQNTI